MSQNQTKKRGRKPKFDPVITRVKLNPEQAVLSCDCWGVGQKAWGHVRPAGSDYYALSSTGMSCTYDVDGEKWEEGVSTTGSGGQPCSSTYHDYATRLSAS